MPRKQTRTCLRWSARPAPAEHPPCALEIHSLTHPSIVRYVLIENEDRARLRRRGGPSPYERPRPRKAGDTKASEYPRNACEEERGRGKRNWTAGGDASPRKRDSETETGRLSEGGQNGKGDGERACAVCSAGRGGKLRARGDFGRGPSPPGQLEAGARLRKAQRSPESPRCLGPLQISTGWL